MTFKGPPQYMEICIYNLYVTHLSIGVVHLIVQEDGRSYCVVVRLFV
jgi:hypothetical protein